MNRFYQSLLFLSGLSLIATALFVVFNIAARELRFGWTGFDAYAGYAIAAALFLALPETLRRAEHLRVTVLVDRLGPRLRAGVEKINLVALVVIALWLSWFSCRLVWQSWTLHDISSGSDATPLWIPQLAMALGCCGFAVASVHALIAHWTGRNNFFVTTDQTARVE